MNVTYSSHWGDATDHMVFERGDTVFITQSNYGSFSECHFLSSPNRPIIGDFTVVYWRVKKKTISPPSNQLDYGTK